MRNDWLKGLVLGLLLPAAGMAGASTTGDQTGEQAPSRQEASRQEPARADYLFAVYLDGKHIGEHHYEVTGAPGSERVRSEANFEFKLLFVTLYRYRHLANEAWQQGCLTHLTAATDDNGRTYEVEAGPQATEAQPELLLTRLSPDPTSREISDCPGTFAYWDLQRMGADALINTQTGELLPTRLIREGSEHIDGHAAVRYRLEIEGMSTIQLWYRADDDGWLRLATRRDGRLLEYRLQVDEQRQPSVAEGDAGGQSAVGV